MSYRAVRHSGISERRAIVALSLLASGVTLAWAFVLPWPRGGRLREEMAFEAFPLTWWQIFTALVAVAIVCNLAVGWLGLRAWRRRQRPCSPPRR